MTSIVSVAEVRSAAGNLDSSVMADADVQHFIDAATITVERWVGPVISRTVTEVSYDNFGLDRLFLLNYPVISVTSVTEGLRGTTPVTVASTAYELDTVTSAIVRVDRSFFQDKVTAVIVAGRSAVPEHIRKGTLNHILNEIRRQKSSGTATFGEASFTTAPKGLDNIVANDLMLDPYFRAGSFG